MRPIEIILLITSTLIPVFFLFKPYKKYRLLSIVLVSFIFLAHLFFEGLRWQMFPAYIFTLLNLTLLLSKKSFWAKNKLASFTIGFFALIFILVGWILPVAFPIFDLPIPKGEYQVGSKQLVINIDRPEIISENPEDKRAFMVKVWYPALVVDEMREPYLDQGNRLGFSSKYGLPSWFTNYFDYFKTNTFLNPEIANGKFPVLVFSHGSYSEAYGYYALMEELVSQGYIVFNLNHTYESSGALFPDGEIKLYHKEFDRKTNNQKMAEMAWNATQEYQNAQNEAEKLAAVEDLIRDYVAAEITERWSEDITDLIDYLQKLENTSFFGDHLDLSKIGVFGHSQGASAAGQAMLDDDRILAGINLDGVQWGTMIDTSFNKPFLLISSEWDENHPKLNKFSYRNLDKENFTSLMIKNSGHSNFMDIPLIVKVPYVNESGTIDVFKAYEIINSLILNFFDKNLLDKDQEKMTDYPEVLNVD
ncbi:hypothetical protein MM213_06970 [Belliella sp. R4-6]|uniref:Platelet-activating factor acetylhydrolase n=1 Tax=Belliella alkalica TaxID=1730871 RepID=A0ABS9V9W9_9BACT|nr:hypothetical protein [Belliella alkalica]MCH7413217.1 hypothetical protein [Belliella alkalica]